MNNDRLLFQVGENTQSVRELVMKAWDKKGITVREAMEVNAHLRLALSAGLELERRAAAVAAAERKD